jgi:hypothetical protein
VCFIAYYVARCNLRSEFTTLGQQRPYWERGGINRETMVVRRGNDSSAWNNTAGAWNKARGSWIALLQAMGMTEELDSMCFGKVLRLMAADVAAWHRLSGGELEPDTKVWSEVPRGHQKGLMVFREAGGSPGRQTRRGSRLSRPTRLRSRRGE